MGKNVLNEIDEYLKRNSSWNGNDLLYLFCKKNPFPNIEVIERQKKDLKDPKYLTSAESIFANQMWLIGRAYAASPERYSYTLHEDKQRDYKDHHPGKPGESFLGTEGYESFFQDIARMLFRPERPGGATTYLRGEAVNLDNEINFLRKKDAASTKALIENLNEQIENHSKKAKKKVGLSDVNLCPKDFVKDIERLEKEVINSARNQLRFFHESLFRDDSWFFAKLTTLSDRADQVTFGQRFEGDSDYIRDLTACVIHFAKALNAARVLRDASVTVRTIRRLQEQVSSSEKALKKSELKQWAAFSKGAKLLIEGAPSVNVSFSSKLLHFYYPKAFFIYDSISASRTPKLSTTFEGFSESAYLAASVMTKAGLKDVLCTYKRNTYEQKDVYPTEKEENGFKNYYQHAARELAFSRFIVKRLRDANCQQYANLLRQLNSIEPRPMESNPFPHCLTITRLVDDLIMNGGTAYQSKDDEQAGSQ